MTAMFNRITTLHETVFSRIESALDGWFLGLASRLAFASVLLLYYWNSALTKISAGFFGFLSVGDNAYYQIVPQVVEAAGYDISAIPVFPWKIMVYMGTYAEFLLPFLVLIGLFTRLSALGMIGFITVQTIVDIAFHDIGTEATGAVFDRFPDAVVADQRLLWIMPLIYLVIKGAGAISVDALLARSRT